MTLAQGNRYLVSFNFTQRDDKKLPYMISITKLKMLTPYLQKLSKIVGDLGKIIVTNGFEKLPKVQ